MIDTMNVTEVAQPYSLVADLYFVEGGSNKFHHTALTGHHVTVTYGRYSSIGSESTKTFDTTEAASKEFFRIVRDKMRKGYRIREAYIGDRRGRRISPEGGFRLKREYGAAVRERADIKLADGAKMAHNLTFAEPDEDLLFQSMFATGDIELIGHLAKTHPAAAESDLTSTGAWLASV